jgi:hypothetical protein
MSGTNFPDKAESINKYQYSILELVPPLSGEYLFFERPKKRYWLSSENYNYDWQKAH